ncbi:MAG TPA: YihY/virulence factor BrkB family protein [Candidatus Limnocylindria bacterium]
MIDRLKQPVARLDDWSRRHPLARVSRRAITGFLSHDALQYAGSMAYFGVLSLFQLLILGIVVGSFLLGEGEAREFVIEQVQDGTPLDAETIAGVIDAAIESRGTLTVVGFGFLLWSALGIFSALSNGISRVFENAPRRGFLRDKLVGLLLMALTGVLALASLVIGIVTGVLQKAAGRALAEIPGAGSAVWLIGLIAPILLIFIAFWVIYRVVPNRPVRWGEVLPGALVAALLWTVLRFGFTWYATSVANYESAFGPLSTGISLLVFLYFASVVILLGAEFARASALDDETGPIAAADPRLLPVSIEPGPGPAAPPKGRLPRPVALLGAAVAGLVIGRLTKRGEDD